MPPPRGLWPPHPQSRARTEAPLAARPVRAGTEVIGLSVPALTGRATERRDADDLSSFLLIFLFRQALTQGEKD